MVLVAAKSATFILIYPMAHGQKFSFPNGEAVEPEPTSPRTPLGLLLVQLVSHISYAAFLLLTATYCLLVYLPFSYFGFIQHPLMGWLPAFVRWHGAIYLGVLVFLAGSLYAHPIPRRTRIPLVSFIALQAIIAVVTFARQSLASLPRDLSAYLWGLLGLFPLLWLAAIGAKPTEKDDLMAQGHRSPLDQLWAAALAGVSTAVAFGITSHRFPWITSTRELAHAIADVAAHVAIFSIVGMVLAFLCFLVSKSRNAAERFSILSSALACLLATIVIRSLVFPALSFDGIQAMLYAATFSAAVIALWKCSVAPPLVQLISSMMSRGSIYFVFCGLLLLLLLAWAIPVALQRTDWDFVLQRMAVIALWAATVLAVRWFLPSPKPWQKVVLSVLICASLLFVTVEAVGIRRGTTYASTFAEEAEGASRLDVSFSTASTIILRSFSPPENAAFFDFLRRNTNLGPEVKIAAAKPGLVENLVPSPGPKPNTFIFVIDSLRQDYVAPYNASVNFAPETAEFAADSFVFHNAFTRYAGTALSEPAIWVGAMLLHEQHLEAFRPLNHLQQLLETDGYQSYVSVDPILERILVPSPSLIRLDRDLKMWNDLDFVSTLHELESHLSRQTNPRPIFAYTQPQNVHTMTLERSRLSSSRREVSIHEIRRIDAAFGEFLAFLKERGLYDNSIIILTADHGESYGEYGRYGHADFLFPEIIRIPLIIHLPPQLRTKVQWDRLGLPSTPTSLRRSTISWITGQF